MCIFSKPVQEVCKTRLIYAQTRDTAGQRWAIQTYANKVTLPFMASNTVMILPVPAKSETIRFLNKKDDNTFDEIFTQLHDKFEREKPMEFSIMSLGLQRVGGSYGSNVLPVFQSGGYEVSTVPCLADFHRLDKSVFDLDDQSLKTTLSRVDASRACGFSYLVFVLGKSATYTPFAYMYPIGEADTHAFIPTMHYHPHVQLNAQGYKPPSNVTNGQVADDWDHEIFILGQAPMATPLSEPHFKTRGFRPIQLKASCRQELYRIGDFMQSAGQFSPSWFDSAYKLVVKGFHQNCDIEFPLNSVAANGVFCDACKAPISYGRRYKCVTCNDIDFCRECFINNKPIGNSAHDGQKGHPVIELKSDADLEVLVKLVTCATALKKAQTQINNAQVALA